MNRDDFVKDFFPVRKQLIAKLEDPDDEVAVFVIAGKGLDLPANGRAFIRLSWALTPLSGLLEISTDLVDMEPVLLIKAISDEVKVEDIKKKLMDKEIVYVRGGKESRVPNPFTFIGELKRLSSR